MRRSLFSELKRRNVWRAAALYAAVAWLLVQVATQLSPYFSIPNWVVRWVVVAAVIGFPFWLAFAWFYELTPEGIKRERETDTMEPITHHTGRTMDRWIIGVLTLAVVLLLTNTFVWRKGAGAKPASDPDAAPDQSIAVLPFLSLSSDLEQEYFAAGISEDLLNMLAKVPALRVAARTSSFSFKGQNLAIPEIARRLNVAHVLEGSVRKAGDQVRITARLVHAADGYQVWSQDWNRELHDVFEVQDEIAGEVVGQLKVKLLGAAPQARETDPRAYALHLQAREIGRQRRPEALARSDSLYRQALAIDPRYTAAWVGLANNFRSQSSLGVIAAEEAHRRGREAVDSALAIDPEFAPAYTVLSWIELSRGDLAGAARNMEKALALLPTDVPTLEPSTGLLKGLGRLKEAIAVGEFAVARDPVNTVSSNNLGNAYLWAGRYDNAITRFRTVLSLRPTNGVAHYGIGVAMVLKGKPEEGLAEIEREPVEAWRMIGLPLAYHALGRKEESDAALAKLIERYPRDTPYNIASIYAFRGEADRAFAWLDQAVEHSDAGLTNILVDNLFDRIRKDPRWVPFLRRIGRAPEQLAKIRFRVKLPAP